MFGLIFMGMSLSLIGKLIVIVAAIRMHSKVVQERQIDDAVVREYKKERNFIIAGALLLIAGFAFEVLGLGLLQF